MNGFIKKIVTERESYETFIWAIIALFGLSLYLPAVSVGHGYDCSKPEWASGFVFFVIGPLGVLDLQFGWFANFFLLLAMLKASRVSAVIAFCLIALTASTLNTLPQDGGYGNDNVCGFGLGYFLWLACSIFVAVAMFAKRSN